MLRVALAACLSLSPFMVHRADADGSDPYAAVRAAQELQSAGQLEQAFLAYAGIPGAQHRAVRIARRDVGRFLDLLRQHREELPGCLADVIAGDLLLAQGDAPAALERYRAVARMLAAEPNSKSHRPLAYLADLRTENEAMDFSAGGLAMPFRQGPGSHRDNLLVRRFIALEAWQDAERELSRLWKLHQARSGPHVVGTTVLGESGAEPKWYKVEPAGFDARGLQFALDFAFFLLKQHQADRAIKVLAEPLLAMDMDRNPNRMTGMQPADDQDLSQLPRLASDLSVAGSFGNGVIGTSRKEFLRLAYGVYKQQGQEDSLVSMLESRIAAGENRFRRILSRIRYHQHDAEGALALELAYIQAGEFNPLTSACRRGQVYEDAGHTAEAIAQYESALKLPFQPLDLPQADEDVSSQRFMQQTMPVPGAGASPSGLDALHADLAARLERLYSALGQPEKAFLASLQRLAANSALFQDLNALEQTKLRAGVVQRETEFNDWLRKQLTKTEDRIVRAHIHWIMGQDAECAAALAEEWQRTERALGVYWFDQWMERFRQKGTQPLRAFLSAVVKADPGFSRARLALLDLQDQFHGAEAMAALEALLASEAEVAFVRGKGVYNPTQFRNYFDLAYRLMRLYERSQQMDKLRRLGLRIAAGDKPFGAWWDADNSQSDYRNENGYPEDLNACLALLIQQADETTLDQLTKLWRPREDFPGKRQLARRLAGGFDAKPVDQDLGWANVPDGVRLVASLRTVLCLACDEQFLYVGHPWGLAVYGRTGDPVTRVALGEAVRAIAVNHGIVWAGTPRGLYRIQPQDWSISHVWLHGDVPERDRYNRSFDRVDSYWFDNCVYSLAADGDDLWIGLHRNVQRLNTKTMTLRAWSYRELKLKNWAGFHRFLCDGRYVWAEGGSGELRRYDPRTDTWDAVTGGKHGVGLIAMIDGVMFGHVWIDDQLRDRPCIIDRDTLELTPLLIEGDLSQDQRCINGPFCYYGTFQGKLLFGPGGPSFVYDPAIQKIRPLGASVWAKPDLPMESPLPEGLRGGVVWWNRPLRSQGRPTTADGEVLCVTQGEGDPWTVLVLPDGTRFVGAQPSHSPRYQYPHEDWPFSDIVSDRKADRGGLTMIRPDGSTTNLLGEFADTLPGDVVFATVADPERRRIWACTNLGIVLLDEAGRVIQSFTRRDGLCANRITSGLVHNGRVYFSAAWGDHGGGLIVADPATRVFTAYCQSDGLATDKLAEIHAADNGIRLVYDVEYGRSASFDYRQFPPGTFDPVTARVTSGGDAVYPKQSDAQRAIAARSGEPGRLTPYLGGFVIHEVHVGGAVYLCGTRGLVIVQGERAAAEPGYESLSVRLEIDPHVAWKAAADQLNLQVENAASLARWLADGNPYVREKAMNHARWRMEQAPADYVNVLLKAREDSHVPVRLMAADLLGKSGSAAAVASLRALLDDPVSEVRDQAALGLARLGQAPDLEYFARMFAARYDASDQFEVIDALASNANAAVFKLLLQYPLFADDYEPRQAVFVKLGQSLLTHPDAAEALLAAYMTERDPGPESNYGSTRFAQEVFQHAGKAMLPKLHEALTSDDRVIRSNAARACGEIGDAASIPHLLKALDLESGLSRGSIVWALGKLRAAEALPLLADLYIDARNDAKRAAGSGYRMAQAVAQAESQFRQIARLDDIGDDWDALRQQSTPGAVDPRRNEPLLSPEIILTAVRNIGPAASQAFYRQLAAERDGEARTEAAARLAEGAGADREANLPILRNLLADRDTNVQMSAAVSLLLLGETDAQTQILAWLQSPQTWDQSRMITQLERVTDGRQLQFARTSLEEIAKSGNRRHYNEDRLRQLIGRIPPP